MDLSVEEILRRLLMLGLPLVPLGCSSAPQHSCPPTTFDMTVTVERSVNPSAWDMCAAPSGDCAGLCYGEAPQHSAAVVPQIATCERVVLAPTSDAGVEAGGDASDSADALTDTPPPDAGTSALTLHIVGSYYPCNAGRRPAGLGRLPVPAPGSAAGRWLARAAALEAASVPAFQRLAEELAAHGAPAHLVAAARSAAVEEARHYALMGRAARARGVEPRRPRVPRMAVRPLPEVARENVREGCVRETFGAMTAVFQSQRIPDRALRAAMASITRDESRHARLAWEVDAWARTVLDPRERHLVDDVRRAAGAELVAELGRTRTPAAVVKELGLPTDAAARRGAVRARQALWIA